MSKTYGYECIDRMVKPDTRGARYGFVHTGAILENLESQGWDIHKVQISRTKDPTTARHLVRLVNPALDSVLPVGLRPTMNILNSHDGQSRLKISIGIYRLVCANGLMIGNDWGTHSVMHRDSLVQDVAERIEDLTKLLPNVAEKVRHYSTIELTREQVENVFNKILALRLETDEHLRNRATPLAFRARRLDDAKSDAFTVFNRAQEYLINGGFGTIKPDAKGDPRFHTVRRITDTKRLVELNKAAWNVLEREVA